MSGISKDLGDIEVVELIAPNVRTTTATSAAKDLSRYSRACIIIHAGTITDGTFTPKIQTSATSGGSYSDDDGTLDSFVANTSSVDDRVTKVDLDIDSVDARWVKLVSTVTGSPSTGGAVGAVLVGVLRKAA